MDNPNSHMVYVRRKPLFDTENRPELEEYFSGSNIGVGSYFAKGTSREASGLSVKEEDLLMPFLLSIPANDRDFRTKVNEYFSQIDTKIPPNTTPPRINDGLGLEIGLRESNEQDITEHNLPINIQQFITYRQVSGHPQVAPEEEAVGNQLKRFYIHDPKLTQRSTNTTNEAKDAALAQYLAIKTDPRKVRMYLVLLGVNPVTLRAGEELTRLRALAEAEPVRFTEVTRDKDKEIRYLIEDMIQHKVLERVGDRILTIDGTQLGRDVKETILFLTDARNTKTYAHLRALMQEAWKKNSVSVDTIEELDGKPESDTELEERLKRKKIEADAIDRASKVKQAKPEETPKGLAIKTELEPTYETSPEGLGAVEAGTEGSELPEDPEAEEGIADDGRAKELNPDKLR